MNGARWTVVVDDDVDGAAPVTVEFEYTDAGRGEANWPPSGTPARASHAF